MGSCNDSSPKGSFEIRSTNLPLVALKLKSTDLSRLGQDFSSRFGEMPGFFDDDGIVIDLSHFDSATGNEATRGLETPLDFSALGSMLREYGLRSVAVRGGNARQVAAAVAAGFFHTPTLLQQKSPASPPLVQCANQPTASVPPPSMGALVIDKPLRCGQQVYARGRDLVVMATVNAGAELIADGHIHVYAPLRGKAFAGATGNTDARVFAMSMASQMIGIAGIYDTGDHPLHESVFGRPAQISLISGPHGNRLVVDEISC